jgi:hypothetical protein
MAAVKVLTAELCGTAKELIEFAKDVGMSQAYELDQEHGDRVLRKDVDALVDKVKDVEHWHAYIHQLEERDKRFAPTNESTLALYLRQRLYKTAYRQLSLLETIQKYNTLKQELDHATTAENKNLGNHMWYICIHSGISYDVSVKMYHVLAPTANAARKYVFDQFKRPHANMDKDSATYLLKQVESLARRGAVLLQPNANKLGIIHTDTFEYFGC